RPAEGRNLPCRLVEPFHVHWRKDCSEGSVRGRGALLPSDPGGGSSPPRMSPELEGQPASEEEAAEEPTVGGRRRVEPVRRSVLVVEDDPAQRAMLVELISLWGY